AIVTPFRNDFSLDEQTLRKLVRRQIEGGVHFLVPCGTTGENPTMTRQEHLRVVEITFEEAKGRVPVLAGAGGDNTAGGMELGARGKYVRRREGTSGSGGGRGRVQHRGSDGAGARTRSDGRRRSAFCYAVLQQAHAGRALSTLQGDRGRDTFADCSLQCAGAL